ncbi:uncharacterized protein A1O9_11290 [Exophiala aquamarina CBS 119918]|uniref:Pyridoxamine 5'-phosphate oxidase N-terminal domain-containing protein n=1 Tax=Exophiala aquamarina CBS 119918 TaxID=1182545 RepID=A0A072NZM6_9EURO|nr:uncharacterized protein A1O9_11290 [Exophiala aquamarina CBS 119918]KEF52872.1 hypothetical protein A1O9_11290 [Exophiala aquamarina CBS 119918]
MSEAHNPPLNYEASATATHRQTSTTLPQEVAQCLKNTRFLHLATISSGSSTDSIDETPTPHVSLMNYTFLPSYSYNNANHGPVIIMTTNAQSIKTRNLLSNPKVSLLVHDWVSHRPPTSTTNTLTGARSGSPPAAATRSSLASLLLNLNTSALSSISTTIAGSARFLEQGSDEEKWCKETHLENNTFGDQPNEEAGLFGEVPNADGNSSCYIAGDDVRVVLVPVRAGRIADWKGGVKDWVVVSEDEASEQRQNEGEARGRNNGQPPLVNGIIN